MLGTEHLTPTWATDSGAITVSEAMKGLVQVRCFFVMRCVNITARFNQLLTDG